MSTQAAGSSNQGPVDDDDVIMILDEEPLLPTVDKGAANLKVCAELKGQIKIAKHQIELSAEEVKNTSRALRTMEAEIGKVVYDSLKKLLGNLESEILVDCDEDAIIEMITKQLEEMDMADYLSRTKSRTINDRLEQIDSE